MSDNSRRTIRTVALRGAMALTVGLGLVAVGAPPAAAAVTDAAPGVTAAAAGNARTKSVTVRRSGGFTGATQLFMVDRATEGRQAATVLTVTATRRFRSLDSQYLPADPCCDRFGYEVVVRYHDGSVKTVTTVADTAGTPQVLTDVIQLVTQVGVPVPTDA
ncbi:hypothetical protein [Actinoplanes siamensis]|uniref:Uncharacterized protein n=1 Tax=Actinoplanes siamensis TaxID=1223317 RepID=A0A919N6G0_9ACTN|nr:hypothetical protein [Actinoplanes siamensis]GIF05246.1 hypothetical protein Asi03nite_27840 [Actinoplanes siamensis]